LGAIENNMEITAIIIALITGIGGLVTGIITARSAATKAELESLRQTIVGLQDENARLRVRVSELEARNEAQDKAKDCLEVRVKLLETENDTLRAEIGRLEIENGRLRRRLSDLEKGRGMSE
jgi:predicted nuclease with TOPRIM domain